MPKKRHLWLAALVVAAVGGLACLALCPREPVYQGKTLTFWLDQYGSNHWMHRDGGLDQQAQTAIRNIGTNAIPIYLRLATVKESRFRLKLMAVVPKRWQTRFGIPDAFAYRNELHRYRTLGAYGIVALGPQARTVVPTLVGLLNDKNPDVRADAIFPLRSLGPVARDALPSLIKCLRDPDPSVSLAAMLGLGEIHQEPDLVIPILIGYLDGHDRNLLWPALWSVEQWRGTAKPAIPNLVRLLNDENFSIRNEATNAINLIDPEAATKAGARWSQ